MVVRSGRERIKPAQCAEAREITIGGAERKPMLYSQRSQMSVWYKIAMHAWQGEKLANQLRMPVRRLRYPNRFAIQPIPHLPPSIANRFWMFEHARISYQP